MVGKQMITSQPTVSFFGFQGTSDRTELKKIRIRKLWEISNLKAKQTKLFCSDAIIQSTLSTRSMRSNYLAASSAPAFSNERRRVHARIWSRGHFDARSRICDDDASEEGYYGM